MLVTVLELLKRSTTAGVSAKELASVARNELAALGGEPAFLGFESYPDVICISINEEVQHSIPTGRVLNPGDIVNFDFGVKYRGLITDAGRMVGVGPISEAARRLVSGTEEALASAIKNIKAGVEINVLSGAIESVLLRHKLGIVRELVGHGVGHQLHEEPEIPNYQTHAQTPKLSAGMTIAIEPIATLGGEEIVTDDDGWTLVTKDGSWAAQTENTVLVTETGSEILTTL